MGVEFAAERRLLSEEEFAPVVSSHYPELAALPHEELVSLARWLRGQHARARDLIRGRRRVHRGKAEARGTAAETASDRGLTGKKQVFARGLKRVNARLTVLRDEARRAEATAALRAALERRKAATPHHPAGGDSPARGATARPNAKRRGIISDARAGSVSQAGRNAQAARDGRGG
ncbi:hypothetical protein [Sediminicoccus sp. KRV36]|uniref:hypothetical protein n=1 Tax=Sediminicoccus sp. KRV36 TaxID=3133721 RepID=UPI00200F7A06|nr:hypothetical protein [Sediminicoccus rosea]UPY38278.1 hypothetical protein LHU95_06155 [Sediminicoccus rosea]